MVYKMKCRDNTGLQHTVAIDRYPDECPICHTSVSPVYLATTILLETPMRLVQTVFQCTKHECNRLFIATYFGRTQSEFVLRRVAPIHPRSEEFPSEIQEVSPTFVKVYNQAIHAEALNLDQLTGIGLRKALEFLVKDFAIYQNEDNEDEIKSTFLGRCIESFIDDENIKDCAKRAAWLGNDETHYVRKWEDKDINDLKVLIRLTVNWIENYLLTAAYRKEMPEETD